MTESHARQFVLLLFDMQTRFPRLAETNRNYIPYLKPASRYWIERRRKIKKRPDQGRSSAKKKNQTKEEDQQPCILIMKAWERDPLPQMMAHPAAGSRKNIPIILTWNTED